MENELLNNEGYSSSQAEKRISEAGARFLTKTYGWMVIALLLSAAAAFFAASNETLLRFMFASRIRFLALCLGELALVSFLSGRIRTMSTFAASVGFVVYSIVNGLTLSYIFLAYELSSIAQIFLIAALMFGFMAAYGAITKRNLNTIGHYCMMALIGLIIAGLVNFFLRSQTLSYIYSFVGVLVFVGFTAYDSQKIMFTAYQADENEAYNRVAILGALDLYLDFINLFLNLLRLFGRRR